MFLSREDGTGQWLLKLTDYELDLFIRFLDHDLCEKLSDRDEEALDKIHKNLFGIRKRYVTGYNPNIVNKAQEPTKKAQSA